MEKFAVINGFQLENEEKLNRVVNGVVGRAGVPQGGLGVDAKPELVLAHYDKLAGYITKDGVKIKTGSFWDFKAQKPRTEPDIKFIFNVGGDKVEVDDPKNLAEAISTLQEVKTKKETEIKEKKAKSKFSKKV